MLNILKFLLLEKITSMISKNLFKSINTIFSGKFAFLASLASILGLIILILKDDWQ